MELTAEQILALAPDSGVASSGRKLATPRGWQGLGRDDAALWGEFQGSARYQVRAALDDLTVKCSCPSRKFPCKHGIGLLLIAVTTPTELPTTEAPGWVTDWLNRRAATTEQRESKANTSRETGSSAKTPRSASPDKTAERRAKRVAAGIDALDLWLDDLLRGGLAQVGTQPTTFWETQAKRLVDAQAPGLAGRLRRMAALPNATRDWPARLLSELGKVALLTHAFHHLDELPAPLRHDLRGAIGWTLSQEEVVAQGEVVGDRWIVLSGRVTVEDRLRTQAVWLRGLTTGRFAQLLQFAHGAGQFEAQFVPGTIFDADLAFWPSAWPQRALVHARRGDPTSLRESLPSDATLSAFFERVATASAQLPWLERFPAILGDVTLIPAVEGVWLLRDRTGVTLPLAGDEHWQGLALAGGAPCTLVGEWDGEALLPLAMQFDGQYSQLSGGQ